MINKAYIHEYGNGKLEREHLGVKNILESRGIDYELFTTKRLRRNQLKLDQSTLVVGDHPTIETVFKRLKFPYVSDSYPESLRPYLKRSISETTLGSLLNESQRGEIGSLFIKPKGKAKLFTGFVVNSNQDIYALDGLSKQTALYCSSLVEWSSEYRVFVNHSKIVGVKHYSGDPQISLNLSEVENAVADFEKSTERTAAYGVDFGVLQNGETALVEWNDGFALGGYDLDDEVYTDLIWSRWVEILKEVFKSC